MKKIAIIFLFYFSLSAKDSYIDFKINPLPLSVGVFSGEIETKIKDILTISATYQGGGIMLADNGFHISAFGIKTTLYQNTIKDDGYYVTPFYQIYSSTIMLLGKTIQTIDEDSFGLIVGHHWDWFDFVNLNLGMGYNYTPNKSFQDILFFTGMLIDFSFGFDF